LRVQVENSDLLFMAGCRMGRPRFIELNLRPGYSLYGLAIVVNPFGQVYVHCFSLTCILIMFPILAASFSMGIYTSTCFPLHPCAPPSKSHVSSYHLDRFHLFLMLHSPSQTIVTPLQSWTFKFFRPESRTGLTGR
jgi:hypothetical protein